MLYKTLSVFTVLWFLVYFSHHCNSKYSITKAIAHTLDHCFVQVGMTVMHLDPQYFYSPVLLQNGIVILKLVLLKKITLIPIF